MPSRLIHQPSCQCIPASGWVYTYNRYYQSRKPSSFLSLVSQTHLRNLPVPAQNIRDRPQSRSPERDAAASKRKTRTRRPRKQRKDKNIVTAVATVGNKKPQSEAQMQQAISRRKHPERPLVECTVPGCEVKSTTEFRKRSKFPLLRFHSLLF